MGASRVEAFAAGSTVLYRETDRMQIFDVKPVTVVQDDADLTALWLPAGTPTKRPVPLSARPGEPRAWPTKCVLEDAVWAWSDILILVAPNAARATWVVWSPAGAFEGWYVNLQSPLTRTSVGFDFVDHQLDVVVNPQRVWRLKDDHELRAAVEQGRLDPAQERRLRAEARRAIADIESNAGPFCDPWAAWKPAASLPRPALDPRWNDLSMYVQHA
jgi:hypothetical protein